MKTAHRSLFVLLLLATDHSMEHALAQRSVPGDPAVLRAQYGRSGLFGPRVRKTASPTPKEISRTGTRAAAVAAKPDPLHTTSTAHSLPVAPDTAALRKLRAVLVVGPVEANTRGYIEMMQANEAVLRESGIQVSTFYHPNARWADVSRAAAGADIFLYSGHGVAHDPRKLLVGGLALTDGIVDTERTVQGLALRPGALVLFAHACFTAGAAAGDGAGITVREAQRRVACYAKPFLTAGAGFYLANNMDHAMADVLERFLTGEPLTVNMDAAQEHLFTQALPLADRREAQIRLRAYGTKWQGSYTRSNNFVEACAGPVGFTIHDLIAPPLKKR